MILIQWAVLPLFFKPSKNR